MLKVAEQEDERKWDFEVLWCLCRAVDPASRLFCCVENKPLVDAVPVVGVFTCSQMQPLPGPG